MTVRPLSAIVLALGLVLTGAASAEEAAPARTWTDPPAKPAPSPVAKRDEVKRDEVRRNEIRPDATTRIADGPVAASGRATRARAGTRSAARPAVRSAAKAAAAARVPREARSHIASRRPDRIASFRRPALPDRRIAAERGWTVRAFQPTYAEGPGFRYGYTDRIVVRPAQEDGFVDRRAERIRAAREAGYLVVRAGDLHGLRGRPFMTLREPEDDESED